MTKSIFNSKTYVNLIRYCLTCVLLLLPFQHRIANFKIPWNNESLAFIKSIDELTIIVFFPLALAEFFRSKEIRDWSYIVLLFPIIVFCALGLISGMVNGNNLLITVIGTLDYIRYFFVIFIYAAFFREVSEVKKIFQMLLVVAVLIGSIAFIQEIWAISSRYMFQEYSGSKIYRMLNSLLPDYSHYYMRFNIYRVPSLMHNFLYMGLYCLLILTIYLFSMNMVKMPAVLALFFGIVVSVSRMAYIGLIFVFGVHLLKNKSKRVFIIIIMIPVLLLMFKLSALWDFNIMGFPMMSESGSYVSETDENALSYREYSRDKAMIIWKDNPIWGVGPGMFGGIVSVKYKSYIYELYNFSNSAIVLLQGWNNIDQFWPIVIAETGIMGTAGFVALFIILYIVLLLSKQKAVFEEIIGLFTGLQVFMLVILIYSTGSVINITQVIFPFFAFVGMGMGCHNAANRI